jgi:hypothetical protein
LRILVPLTLFAWEKLMARKIFVLVFLGCVTAGCSTIPPDETQELVSSVVRDSYPASCSRSEVMYCVDGGTRLEKHRAVRRPCRCLSRDEADSLGLVR